MKKRFYFLIIALCMVVVHTYGQLNNNVAKIMAVSSKIDVWDFGAEQLDTEIYNNQLSVEIINSWYASSITAGSSGNVFPTSFTAGILSWVGGSNDRLRTTNTSLTRYDANIASQTVYTGRLYVNAGAATGRYLSLTLNEDDEVTLVTRTDAGGKINFKYVTDPAAQTDVVTVSDLVSVKFVAKATGTYQIFDSQGKPSYFRISRKAATYKTLTGTIDTTEGADIPIGYGVAFTNTTGKTWNATVTNNEYSVNLPSGYTYSLSLTNANGYIITTGKTIEVTETTSPFNVSIKKVDLYTLIGTITGLGTEVSKLGLNFTPFVNSSYVPEPVVNASAATYTVQLEAGFTYTISALGLNDYYIPDNSVTMAQADATKDLTFALKPVYTVTINTENLTAEQVGKLNLTFSNLNETGYIYNFSPAATIALRDGTYSIAYSGLDEYPIELGLTSNLKITGANTSKSLFFKAVRNWSFDDKTITSTTANYKGMQFTGNIANEIAKGHLTAKPAATIRVPMTVGDKMKVTYYYSADFSIDGGTAITTASNSTSIFEHAEYTYPGTEAGYATITIGAGAGTTYITDITVEKIVAYKASITVGTDKEYKSVNEALEAIARMSRPNDERVTIIIDPGNYEEMLVINVPNVTLKNAAQTPDINLINKGVDIGTGAVRITSYYGHGYSYYSMGTNQKWNADILRVNKENGLLSYENKGAGTTNGSYWNATVVVAANGFEAENIIFENSFNQYISKKESEDVIVLWESGNKGLRSNEIGNTSVQSKSYVERAAAIAIANGTDKVVFNKCRMVGRQDSFFGGTGSRVVVYKGAVMGGTDFLFGPMTAVFYKTDLAMNTSDESTDVSYITAAQQSSGRGYLMYECTVKSAVPGFENASSMKSKPGYFGRPWQATTSEVVFYNTTIETTDFTGSAGASLIIPVAWLNSLGGESNKMYEYGTVELSGVNNSANRVSWSTVLTTPTLTDGTAINTFNFTKGTDNWDPIPELINKELGSSIYTPQTDSKVQLQILGNKVSVTNVKSDTGIQVYAIDGTLIKSVNTKVNTDFELNKGLWIVNASSAEGNKTIKVIVP